MAGNLYIYEGGQYVEVGPDHPLPVTETAPVIEPVQALHNVGKQNAVAVSTSVVSLTVPIDARHALITINSNSMSWLAMGATTVPTASVGNLVTAGTIIDLTDPHFDYHQFLMDFRIIRVSADGTIDVMYFD